MTKEQMAKQGYKITTTSELERQLKCAEEAATHEYTPFCRGVYLHAKWIKEELETRRNQGASK